MRNPYFSTCRASPSSLILFSFSPKHLKSVCCSIESLCLSLFRAFTHMLSHFLVTDMHSSSHHIFHIHHFRKCYAARPCSVGTTRQVRTILPSYEIMASLLRTMLFTDGIGDILNNANPPNVAFLKSLPDDFSSDEWGVYVLVFEKPGFRTVHYVSPLPLRC